MSGFDIGVVVFLSLFALRGYRCGMGREIIAVLTILAAAWLAVRVSLGFAGSFSGVLSEPLSEALDLTALGAVYLIAYAGLRIVLAIARRLWISVGTSAPSRLVGMLVGGLKGALLAGFVLAFAEGAPPFEGALGRLPAPAAAPVKVMGERVSDSVLVTPLVGLTGQVVSALIAVGRSTTSQARTYTSGAS